MAKVNLTDSLKEEYENLYNTCEIKPAKFDVVDNQIKQILKVKAKYQTVENKLGTPWFVVAAIHTMESGRNFSRHLHNGDPLSGRTTHVPAGRPAEGNPPFTWEESATDALKLRKLDVIEDWSLSRILYELEGYNGWGYRRFHTHVKSPYLWSHSNHYISGKYIADGTWSDTAVSRQTGAAVLIRRLAERGEIIITEVIGDISFFKLSDQEVPRGADLQRFLNTFESISLRVDGWPGKKTSDAVKKLFGHYLAGDSREDS